MQYCRNGVIPPEISSWIIGPLLALNANIHYCAKRNKHEEPCESCQQHVDIVDAEVLRRLREASQYQIRRDAERDSDPEFHDLTDEELVRKYAQVHDQRSQYEPTDERSLDLMRQSWNIQYEIEYRLSVDTRKKK